MSTSRTRRSVCTPIRSQRPSTSETSGASNEMPAAVSAALPSSRAASISRSLSGPGLQIAPTALARLTISLAYLRRITSSLAHESNRDSRNAAAISLGALVGARRVAADVDDPGQAAGVGLHHPRLDVGRGHHHHRP